jgi:hypothetical protein
MDIWPGGIPDGDALVKAALQHEMIQRSPLVRVVAIGKAVEDDGVVLELIALEIRDVGAVLYWKAQPVGEYVLGGPDFVVTDDVGRSTRSSYRRGCPARGWPRATRTLFRPRPSTLERCGSMSEGSADLVRRSLRRASCATSRSRAAGRSSSVSARTG